MKGNTSSSVQNPEQDLRYPIIFIELFNWLKMRNPGLEPGQVASLEPESSASTNSASSARLFCFASYLTALLTRFAALLFIFEAWLAAQFSSALFATTVSNSALKFSIRQLSRKIFLEQTNSVKIRFPD